jgi:6-phospho-3-hexuloisomerase
MKFDFKQLEALFNGIRNDAAENLACAVSAHSRVFVHGAGRSGLMIKAFAMRLAQAGLTVHAVGDCTTPSITTKDILVVASASGKTYGVVRCAETARSLGAKVFCITATPESELADLADCVICFPAPTKDSADAGSLMGTLFEEALLLFFDDTVNRLDATASEMRSRHANLE